MVGGTVLVVEHEAPVRAYLEQQLADDGFEVLSTDRATAALELVEQARPSEAAPASAVQIVHLKPEQVPRREVRIYVRGPNGDLERRS